MGKVRFGGFVLDAGSMELRDEAGDAVEIPPQAFDLLAYLIAHRDRIVPKDELFDELWGDVVVSENSLAQSVWAARRAVRDTGGAQRVIKNIRGRGYRFVGELDAQPAETAGAPARERRRADREQSAVVEPTAPRIKRQSAPTPRAPMIGRGSERSRLLRMLEGLRTGSGRACFLSGPAGAGKTRLLEDVREMAFGQGIPVYTGHCHDDAAMPPFWPWQRAARALIGELPSEAVAEVAGDVAGDLRKLIPELEEAMPELRSAPERDSDENRYQLFDAICRLFTRAARRGPIVVAIEDLHWADEASIKLLEYAAQTLPRTPVLLLATLRDEMPEALRATLTAALKRSSCEALELGGLEADDAAALLERSMGRAPSPALADRVVKLTGGNPFFVQQLGGMLAGSEGDELELPRKARTVLRRRLQALPAACLELLQLSAVVGQELHVADLRRVVDHDGATLVELLEQACDAQVIEEPPGAFGEYRFTHPTMRETLLEDMPRATRMTLHRRVADGLAAAYAEDPGARLDEIALHYWEAALAGCAPRAVRYCKLAAERAFEATAFEEAVAHYDRALRALEMVDAPDERLRCQLLIGRGHAAVAAGVETSGARESFARAAEIATSIGDAELLGEAAAAHAGRGALRMAVFREAGTVDAHEIGLLERALAALGEQRSAERAIVCGWLAYALYNTDQNERREALADESVAIARELGDERILAEALLAHQSAVRGPAHLNSRIAMLEELRDLTRRTGLKGLQLDAHSGLSWAFYERGDDDDAQREAVATQRLAEELGESGRRRWTDSFAIMRAGAAGRLDEVEEFLERRAQMVRPGKRADQSGAIHNFTVTQLRDKAHSMLKGLADYAERFPLTVAWRCGLANACALCNEYEEARRQLDKISAADFAAIPDDHNWLSSHTLIANCFSRLPDPPMHAVEVLYEKMAPYAGRFVTYGIAGPSGGSVERSLGQLASLLGKHDLAEQHLLRSLEDNARTGAQVWVHFSQLDLVAARQAAGRDGTPSNAQLLAEAREFGESHGVHLITRRVAELQARH